MNVIGPFTVRICTVASEPGRWVIWKGWVDMARILTKSPTQKQRSLIQAKTRRIPGPSTKVPKRMNRAGYSRCPPRRAQSLWIRGQCPELLHLHHPQCPRAAGPPAGRSPLFQPPHLKQESARTTQGEGPSGPDVFRAVRAWSASAYSTRAAAGTKPLPAFRMRLAAANR